MHIIHKNICRRLLEGREKNNDTGLLYVEATDSNDNIIFNMTAVIIFHWIVWAVLAQIVVVFGVISNIINVVCFVKQGFKDSINVSLTGVYCCTNIS